eukprot:1258857-Rhodomonas_salina.1
MMIIIVMLTTTIITTTTHTITRPSANTSLCRVQTGAAPSCSSTTAPSTPPPPSPPNTPSAASARQPTASFASASTLLPSPCSALPPHARYGRGMHMLASSRLLRRVASSC